MNKKLLNEIKLLKEQLKKWGYQYYVKDNPSVSDEIYDAAIQRLIFIEKENPQLATSDSPTKRIGGGVLSTFEKITHQYPMLSLSNAFNEGDLIKFDNDIKKVSGLKTVEYFVELKIDGLAVSIVYEDNKLKYAATRGDGFVGENITENISKIFSIPLNFNNNISHFEIRGEVFLSKKEFLRINQEKSQKKEKLFANPRNAAAGSLRVLDSSISKSRKLKAFLYWMSHAKELNITKQSEIIDYLDQNKVNTSPHNKLCKGIDEVISVVNQIIKNRDDYPFEIDGVVIKVNRLDLRKIIGSTVKHPKWATAYKLPTEKVESIVLDIFPTVGRTGKITYNARLQPTRIAGTIVSAATLHNADFIAAKDIRISDYVLINKAGDIIPEVLKVIKEKRDKKNSVKWIKASKCPSCQSLLQNKVSDVDQFCLNPNCDERRIQNLIHFTSRKAMNITGLGEKVIRRLYKLGFVKSIQDIYLLEKKADDLKSLERFGEKSINNLLLEIQNCKQNQLDRLLFALGIKHIGFKSAKLVAQNFNTLENIMNIEDVNAITSIYEIGDKIASSLFNWTRNEQNRNLVDFLKAQNQNTTYANKNIINKEGITNKTFVITGKLPKPRKFYQDQIEEHGGNVSSAISSKTDYLLLGENAGSKKRKAIELNIKIINVDYIEGKIKNEI